MPRNFINRRRRNNFGQVAGNFQKRIKKENQAIEATSGEDGDQALRKVPGKGLFQYVKDSGKWKCIRYMEGPMSLTEEINKNVPNLNFRSGKRTIFNGNAEMRTSSNSFRFYDSDRSHYTGLKAHATTTGSVDYVLPPAKPGSNKLLQSDSSGNLTWATQGGGGNMANNTILGNISGSTGVGGDLTGTQVRTLCGLATSDAVTFATVDTGQGANELYDMDQNVKTDSTVGFAEITSGAVVWATYPVNGYALTNARGYYFRDSDDYDDFRRWDDFDADMVLNYRKIWGHYIVPEDCTLKRMQGIIANSGDTEDVTVNVWYCLQTNIETDTTSTTFTKAGSDNDVTIGTSLVGVQFNEDYDVDLTAGSIVIPTLKTAGSTSQTYYGTLTLKYITR